MADERIVAQDTFEQAIKDILTELVNSTYEWEEYTPEQISDILEITDEEAMQLTKILNDQVVANNKLWSSSKTDAEIKNALIESNKYADELIGGLASISLEVVDTLPTTGESNVIYILKNTSTNINTLNVYSNSNWIEVGNLNLDLTTLYTKSEVDAELVKKANADEVLKPDAIVSDLTTTSGTTTLSTAGLKTELDKKANDDEVVKTTDITTTIDSTSTDSQVASAKAVYDSTKDKNMKSYTTVKQLGLSYPCTVQDIWMALPPYSTISVLNEVSANYITDCPANYGMLTIDKINNNRFRILYSQSNGASINTTAGIWFGQLKGTDGSGLIWTPVDQFTKAMSINGTTTDCFTLKPGIYNIGNGCSKTMNFPYDDTNAYNGTVMVFGSYNVPNENKGYRRMIYMDNKQRMAVAFEWWGGFVGGWRHVGKSKVEDVPKTTILSSNSNFTFGSHSCYSVVNGICYVSIWEFKGLTVSRDVAVATGMPKPKQITGTSIINANDSGDNVAFIYVDNSNALCVNTFIPNVYGYGSFSYPVAES